MLRILTLKGYSFIYLCVCGKMLHRNFNAMETVFCSFANSRDSEKFRGQGSLIAANEIATIITVREQLLPITLLSTQDGGRHSGQGCLQSLFRTSMHVSNDYPHPSDTLQYVGFTGVMWWSVGVFSWRNRVV